MNTKKKKTYIKLGYTHMDTAEIVTVLNRLLSGYSVYQQVLRNFHWNVTGADFFDLHQLFEAMYKRAIDETDQIAERIRLFDQRPASRFTEYLELSVIKEESPELSSFEMVRIVLSDIRLIIENMEEGVRAAKEISDNGTEHMLQGFIYEMEKEHWMLTEWMKQNV